MVSEISQSQKDKYCMIPVIWISRIGKFMETETRLKISQDLGETVGSYYLMVTVFGVMENIHKGVVVMVARHW